jgi:hypothetical protein
MRSKLTYANVTATLALFLALGGSSYAVVQFTGKNVKDESLTSKDVKNRSLLRRDFKPGQLPAGAQGAKGDPGIQGIQGTKDNDGAPDKDGAPGAPGSALAFADVTNFGGLSDAPYSKNVDRATQAGVGAPILGVYCLHTTVEPHNAVATIIGEADSGEINAQVYSSIHCNGAADPGYNVVVHTYDSAGGAANRGFFVTIN